MGATSVQSLVLERAPVRRGHFLLGSGMHTPYYVELEAIVQDPVIANSVCRAIVEKFHDHKTQVVLAAAGPDAVLAYELARQLNARAIFAEGPHGHRMLRSAFQVKPDERVLIVLGVVVTGDSARELIRLVRSAAGQVVGAAALVDRSSVTFDLGVPLETLAVVDLESYMAPVCPLCAEGQPLERRKD